VTETGMLVAECVARAVARGVFEATPLPVARRAESGAPLNHSSNESACLILKLRHGSLISPFGAIDAQSKEYR